MIDFDDFDDIFKRLERILNENYTGGYSYKRNTRNYDNDIFQDNDNIYISLELRVQEEDLVVTPEKDSIILELMMDGSWNKRTIKLPSLINPKTAKITFNNYVLDITLEKLKGGDK